MNYAGVITVAVIVAASSAEKAGGADAESLTPFSGRLTGGVEIGFDSFQEEYSVVDADTVDSVHEFRSRVRLGYAIGSAFHNYIHGEGRALVGDGNYEAGGHLRLARVLGESSRSRLSIDGDYLVRRFDESSAYEFANDLARLYLRSYLRVATSARTAVRISDRLETVDFDERTDFDYDYVRNHVSVHGEYDWGLSSTVATGLRFTTMSVPDSSEIEYVAWTPSIEVRTITGVNRSAFMDASVERRTYEADTTRSSFWALLATGGIEIPLETEYSVELRSELESYQYDVSTGSYFDYVRNRSVLLFNYTKSWNFKAGVGPAFGFSNSPSSEEDEYREYGVRLRLDYSHGTDLWISGWYEPGRRKYPSYNDSLESDLPSIFSDYTYHRVSLFATSRIVDGLSANLFVDYEPEDHERASDDATATLLSVSLSYLF